MPMNYSQVFSQDFKGGSPMQVTEDRKLLIAVGRSRKAALWQNKEIMWSELLDKLATG